MRVLVAIVFLILTGAFCLAQEQESELKKRLDSSLKNWNEGLSSPLNGKKFEGTADLKIKTSEAEKASFGDRVKSYGAESYTTRSFFGLKNPWFGKKVLKTENASLWTKSAMPNGNKKFETDPAATREFYQANKKDFGTNHIVEKKEFIPPQGKAQGMLDASKPQLSIDEVRDILNKNR